MPGGNPVGLRPGLSEWSLPPPFAVAPGGGKRNGWGGAGGRSRPLAAPRGKPVAAQNHIAGPVAAQNPLASLWQRRAPWQRKYARTAPVRGRRRAGAARRNFRTPQFQESYPPGQRPGFHRDETAGARPAFVWRLRPAFSSREIRDTKTEHEDGARWRFGWRRAWGIADGGFGRVIPLRRRGRRRYLIGMKLAETPTGLSRG